MLQSKDLDEDYIVMLTNCLKSKDESDVKMALEICNLIHLRKLTIWQLELFYNNLILTETFSNSYVSWYSLCTIKYFNFQRQIKNRLIEKLRQHIYLLQNQKKCRENYIKYSLKLEKLISKNELNKKTFW